MEFGPEEMITYNKEMVDLFFRQFQSEEAALKKELQFTNEVIGEARLVAWTHTPNKQAEIQKGVEFAAASKELMKVRSRQLNQRKLELITAVDPKAWAKIKFEERQCVINLMLIDNEMANLRIAEVEEQLLGFDKSFGIKNLSKNPPVKVKSLMLIQNKNLFENLII